MKYKLIHTFVLMLIILQTNVALANGNMVMADEEICLVQVRTDDDNKKWTYKRTPQKCPLQLFIEGNKLHFFVDGLPVTSNVRIYESIKETECASFYIDVASHEEVSLPASLTGGDYVVIVVICDEIYKGTFALQ